MFTGYSDKTMEFMWGIRLNNNRDWFTAHKEEYLSHLYQPTMELGRDVYEKFMEKFPKSGLHLHVCRIYRDARRLHGPTKTTSGSPFGRKTTSGAISQFSGLKSPQRSGALA